MPTPSSTPTSVITARWALRSIAARTALCAVSSRALGYRVVKLDRVQFAGLTKKNVRRGDWRFLTEKEVEMLAQWHVRVMRVM